MHKWSLSRTSVTDWLKGPSVRAFVTYLVATVAVLLLLSTASSQQGLASYTSFFKYDYHAIPAWVYVPAGLGTLFFLRLMADFFAYLLDGYWKSSYRRWIFFYIAFCYFLNASYRINAVHFAWWNPFYAEFLQYHLWVLMGIPFLVASIHKLLYQKGRLTKPWKYLPVAHNVYLFVASVLSLHTLVVLYFRERNMEGFALQHYGATLGRAVLGMALAYAATYLLVRVLIRSNWDIQANRASLYSSFGLSVLLAFVFHFLYQVSMAGAQSYFGRYLFPGAFAFQVLMLTLLSWMIYLIVNRQVLASFIIVLLNSSLVLINFVKFRYRAEPLTPTDFKWARDLKLILDFINVRIVFFALALIAVLVYAYLFCRKRFFTGRVTYSFWKRIGFSAAIVALIASLGLSLRFEKDNKIPDGIPIFSSVNNWRNVNWKGYTFIARYRSLSFLWLQQLSKDSMERPDGYSQAAIENIVQKYGQKADELNQSRTNDLSDQTVIYVLSESLANPKRVPGVKTSKELLPNISRIEKHYTGGLMQSNHYGGGTANVEFQAYTGLPFTNFTSSISAVYLDIFPNMNNYGAFISNHFEPENRIALHPYYNTSYNRNVVYDTLDFAAFWTLSAGEHQLQPTEQDKIGNYTSDQYAYEMTLQKMNPTKNQFIALMTMQNHVKWNQEEPKTVKATGKGFSAEQNADLTSYARLLTYTDTATQNFLNALNKLDQKVTVVFYGDHLPGLYPESTFESKPQSQYQTDYFVWSNYTNKVIHYPLVKSSDLSALLFETTNSQVSPYYALLTQVMKHASVTGGKYDAQAAQDLKMVQYDMTAGQGYLKKYKEFFQLPSEKEGEESTETKE